MCMSRLHQVVELVAGGRLSARDLDGAVHDLAMLAYDGPALRAGDWVVAHSGFVLGPATDEDVEVAVAEWDRLRAMGRDMEEAT